MMFVQDTVAGFLAVAESSGCIGEVTNLATGIGVTIGDLLDRIVGAGGPQGDGGGTESASVRRPARSSS